MEYLIPVLIFLFILLVIVTLVGHGIWLVLAWFFRALSGSKRKPRVPSPSPTEPSTHPCLNCGYALVIETKFCGVCGAHRLTLAQEEQLRELETTLRQLERLHQSGVLNETNFRVLKAKIENEREQMLFPQGRPGAARQPLLFTPEIKQQVSPSTRKSTAESEPQRPPPSVVVDEPAREDAPPQFGAWTKDSDEPRPAAPILKPPRKPFAEVLAAFMEQSNIRWGEIVGGVLIIGCSTALVISLWAQISRVPVLKFLIFTTVTAALFGVGFYTEHRWKLPTTSRGILTIATLLVPLNFLAIAAVSANTSPGALVIGSEIIAPALFLCLVYFAGRVIAPAWPHLLAAGALGSSVGQLLIRHFAAPDNSANVLVALGAFPVLCYVVASGWMLKLALADGEIDEAEANAIFIMLGALTFAVVLPFGLLLHRSESTGMAMMHLAPLVTLGGTPLLTGGMLVWQRVRRKEWVATRTAGASIAIIGMAMALAGMVLAWPNPASVVPAALFNFALFTAVAVFLDEPRAHIIAAGCLTLSYVIAFHVLAGHVPWENLRVVSLLRTTESASTGQALAIPFVAFALVHEWLSRKRKGDDAFSYLLAACGVAVVSLLFLAAFGIRLEGDPHYVSAILALYAVGAFWFAWREKFVPFTWIGAALLFLTSAQVCHSLLSVRFPWQASCLFFAAACLGGALIARQFSQREVKRLLVTPLQKSSTAGGVAAALLLITEIIWYRFEPSAIFASRAYILAGVWLGLLVIGRASIFSIAFQLTLAVGAMLSMAEINGSINPIVVVRSLQLDAIAAASVGLLWMATRKIWTKNDTPAGNERGLLICQKWIAISFAALFIVPVTLHLIALPYRAGAATFASGSFNGWLAVLLTVAVAVVCANLLRKPVRVAGFAASMLAMGSLASFGVARFGVAKWAGFHVLLGALILTTWLLLLAKNLRQQSRVLKFFADALARLGLTFADDWEWDIELFAAVVGAASVLVALRGPFSDPLGAWWSIGALLAISALAASLHWVTLRRGYLYAAGILFNLSVSIWLIKYQNQQVSSLSAFVQANVIALSLTGGLWLCLELRARRAKSESESNTAASFHNFAALLSLIAMGSVIAIRLHDDLFGFYQVRFPVLDLFALASLALLMAACLWDRQAKYAVAGLYLIGLLIIATVLHHVPMTPRHLSWALTMALAVHAFVAALIWRQRERVVAWADRLKIPPRIDPAVTELAWLSVFNSLVVATAVCLVFWIDLSFLSWAARALAAIAVAAQVLTFGLIAQGRYRVKWQRAAIAMFLIGAVFLGWSFLTPGTTGTWLNRAVILMTLMFASVALFGAELNKLIEREAGWTKAFRDCVPVMTIAGIISLGFVLCTEVYYQIEFGAVRVRFFALVTVAATLAAAVAICIFFSVSPRHDPLSLSERRRGRYVYAAEVMLALLFMHIRLTMPWLFHGFFQRYWPLVVLAIAYTGVAISEMLRRKQAQVLAQPIERTGAFLPLLPVIGFWIAQSQVEYSTLLFVVGGLYGLLSILRSSFWFGLAAALAGNGGLWYLLHETSEYHFLQHPQLWLIPAAISVLIAAQLNRKDFSEAQMTGVRYLCLVTIYVSSTADIFLNGVARSPWLPLMLAGLSIAGVFAGMIFRVRAFLLLGSLFLLLAIATMINYASVNFGWTWLWYVAGIVTGAAIITTFAVFEKKRAEVLRVVEELKDWKG